MVDLKRIEIKNESLSENIIVLTQSILIQGWQQTTSHTFHFTDSSRVYPEQRDHGNLIVYSWRSEKQ